MELPDDFEVIIFQPGQPVPRSRRRQRKGGPPTKKWERLAGRVGLPAELNPRIDALGLVRRLLFCRNNMPIEAALLLADGLGSMNDTEQTTAGLVLTSLCATLDRSGKRPETLDRILRKLVQSSNTKYLDRIKRGAILANETIADWAAQGDGDQLQRLDRATQAVLQGSSTRITYCLDCGLPFTARLSVSQWSVLCDNGQQVKERILSRSLPRLDVDNQVPLLLPCIVHLVTNGSLTFVQSYLIFLSICTSPLLYFVLLFGLPSEVLTCHPYTPSHPQLRAL